MSEESGEVACSDTLSKPLFRDITAEDYDPEIMEIESLCVSCEDQGTTRLFLTKIPFFREVIVSSFSCDHCGYRNAELQPGGKIQDRGVSYKVNVTNESDLNRQVVQTEYASIRIPKLEFEIPPGKSALTTIEGVIDRAVEGLAQDQVLRRIQHPEVAVQIEEFIGKLQQLKLVKEPFLFVIDDPSGNSFVENPYPCPRNSGTRVTFLDWYNHAPTKDPQMTVGHYARTMQQDEFLGLVANPEVPEKNDEAGAVGQDDGEGLNTQNEVLSFKTNCPQCSSPCDTHMKLVNIPHFKEVVIMATICDKCGHRDNEVKSSGGIEDKGHMMKLEIQTAEDMARDVLKSETASVQIPELDFEMEMGTLGGKFTTIEGLLLDIKSQLKESNPFFHGDSSQPEIHSKLSDFCRKLDDIVEGKWPGCHLVLDDPAGNSFIQSLCAPDPDPQLVVTQYTRSWEQNEQLGLNDMKTENYEES